MSHEVTKLKREAVEACMTCPLCHKLYREATTVVECLHTFCRLCIYKKLVDEETGCCPVCKIHLGCAPLEKLKSDIHLQDIKEKLFPSKKLKAKIAEASSPLSSPSKKKRKSLSSLKFSDDDIPNCHRSSKVQENRSEASSGGKRDAWKHLTSLAEAANSSKRAKFEEQEFPATSEEPSSDEDDVFFLKAKKKELRKKRKVRSIAIRNDRNPQEAERPRTSRKPRARKGQKDMLEAKVEKQRPIWFTLKASDESAPPLRQIPASYLRIKDGSTRVSSIQKYLKMKLDLKTEDEVEIRCMGQAVACTLPLKNLLDQWLKTTGPERLPTKVGSSAQDFVMVLFYSRQNPRS